MDWQGLENCVNYFYRMNCMKFPVYLINLDGSDERLRSASAQLSAAGIQFQRVSAFDGRRLRIEDFPDYDEKSAIKYMGRPLRGGEIGCYLSHLACAKMLVDSGEPFAVVLEDDLRLVPDAAELIEWVIDLAEKKCGDGWYLINIGPNKHKIFSRLGVVRVKERKYALTRAHYFPMMTSGLIWSREGAKAFVENHDKIRMPVDNFFRRWLTRNDKGLAVWPAIVMTSGVESEISGDVKRSLEGRHPMYGWRKQKRLMYDKVLALLHKMRFVG